MKRINFIAVILIFASVFGIYAAEQDGESEFYVKTFAISQIYRHALAFKVDYFKSDRTLGAFWIPREWLKHPGNIGTIVHGKGLAYPYATFFYKDGEINHFRLYLIDNEEDLSWGVLEQGVDYDQQIPSPDSKLTIQF